MGLIIITAHPRSLYLRRRAFPLVGASMGEPKVAARPLKTSGGNPGTIPGSIDIARQAQVIANFARIKHCPAGSRVASYR